MHKEYVAFSRSSRPDQHRGRKPAGSHRDAVSPIIETASARWKSCLCVKPCMVGQAGQYQEPSRLRSHLECDLSTTAFLGQPPVKWPGLLSAASGHAFGRSSIPDPDRAAVTSKTGANGRQILLARINRKEDPGARVPGSSPRSGNHHLDSFARLDRFPVLTGRGCEAHHPVIAGLRFTVSGSATRYSASASLFISMPSPGLFGAYTRPSCCISNSHFHGRGPELNVALHLKR